MVMTVLLVGMVAVAVGIVTFWGTDLIKDTQSKAGVASAQLSCTGVKLDVSPTGSSITVQNVGSDIAGVLLVIHGGGSAEPVLFSQPMKAGDTKTFPYTGVPGIPSPDQVDVVATMGIGINRPCTSQKEQIKL